MMICNQGFFLMNDTKFKKISNLLGLAQRSGNLTSGEFSIAKPVKSGKIKLLIVANDVSDETNKQYYNMAQYYNIMLIKLFTKDELGNMIGKGYRAAVAVNDHGFAKAIINLYKSE